MSFDEIGGTVMEVYSKASLDQVNTVYCLRYVISYLNVTIQIKGIILVDYFTIFHHFVCSYN